VKAKASRNPDAGKEKQVQEQSKHDGVPRFHLRRPHCSAVETGNVPDLFFNVKTAPKPMRKRLNSGPD
jgi:hypothetical protein